jgi:D-beta-D-heptose 7-phosphate kinase / D-beta-D-heptose 1-phosphate adenosyltransferase
MAYVSDKSRKKFFKGSSIHKEKKQWGEEHWIVNKDYCGKKLILRKDRRCSMHSHKEKDEVFYIQSGKILLELDGKEYTLRPGDFMHIPAGSPHRFTGLEKSEIFEFSTNHKEEDSYRTEYSGHIEQDRFEREAELLKAFKAVRVLVIGDVMLDTYVEGSVERISPEAPIPVMKKKNRKDCLGGAGNAARNVTSLGGKATLVGVRGDDQAGKRIEALLKKSKVSSALIADERWPTLEKHRVVSGAQQIVRIDFEEDYVATSAIQKKLFAHITKHLKKCDVVLLSDYAKGVFSPSFLKEIIALANRVNIPTILDPKPFGPEYMSIARGVTLMKPNHKETLAMVSHKFPVTRNRDVSRIGQFLSRSLKSDILLTLGAQGMHLHPRQGQHMTFPALAHEVADISGAGDTVSAVLALSVGAGAQLSDAVDLANRAASIVVGKKGTATVSSEELKDVL